jgi:hypothetical protein
LFFPRIVDLLLSAFSPPYNLLYTRYAVESGCTPAYNRK